MNTHAIKKVTIIAESVLELKIIDDIKRLGAKGYTLIEVRGEGTKGRHASDWAGNSVKIETLVTDAVAEAILQRMADEYFEYYAIVAFAENVTVVRQEKFS